MDVITYALAKKMGGGGGSITYTLTADTENKTIVLTPSEGTAQVITVPYATDASTVNGHEVPELENGKIPANYLPSFVDNVDEYDNISLFPVVGESNRIYIDKSTNKTYRWSGTAYVEISESIALGETSSTAYRGDRGKIAYDHSQSAHAPSNAEANQNAFSNVKIDSDIINASAKTDTLEFIAGDNIILTPNVSNKKITVSQVPVRKTASGDIASFSDGTGNPFLEVKVNIEPVQDLHGYDYPWVGGAGKNKCDLSTFTHTGVADDSGGVGTYNHRLFSIHIPVKSDTTYTLSLTGSKNGENIYVNRIIYFDSNDTFIQRYAPGDNQTISFTTLSSAEYIQIDLRTKSLYNIEITDISKIQLEEGSTATSWTPYSNICPISGHTDANVTVTDDLTTPTETHTLSIPFHDSSDNPITVYGGRLDVTSGELTATLASVDLGTLSWTYQSTGTRFVANLDGVKKSASATSRANIICSKYIACTPNDTWNGLNNAIAVNNTSEAIFIRDTAYTDSASFKTAMSGVQLVYELATPITYQLTPTQVTTLLGQNNIFADCGQIEVAYKTPFYTDLTTKNEVQVLINESITSALNASY